MKTEFELESANEVGGIAAIIGTAPKYKPYVSFEGPNIKQRLYIKDKDLERFAVNILKALKSDKLK